MLHTRLKRRKHVHFSSNRLKPGLRLTDCLLESNYPTSFPSVPDATCHFSLGSRGGQRRAAQKAVLRFEDRQPPTSNSTEYKLTNALIYSLDSLDAGPSHFTSTWYQV